MAVTLKSPADIQDALRARFRARRLVLNLTQEGLANRSGVTLATLRRFERTGLIAFDSLLKLALVLDCLGDFEKVAAEDERSLIGRPLDAVLAQKRGRRKGRIT
ncbi:transcriptional regulator [Hyphomicrobium nitrativorans NL23]|uniref:Transcriptional regulator n=1 Tax=Hyphomicrobium nitrativorans NL23 TaxID=1029756 RepID=V5SAM2_9HYPH|nr:helix-turn-helix transcriptional regulator [Hyphomicrobium nitrativorans]AHB47693.1 transcriptional regulator [Hyphomicrobium nitrativorans NL23]